VTDLLLRQAQPSRAGAQGDDDYNVFGTDGIVIGRIFKATTSPAGTPWMWTLAYGDHEDRTPTHGYEATREAAMQAFAKSCRVAQQNPCFFLPPAPDSDFRLARRFHKT
jgi:hypothetical protein